MMRERKVVAKIAAALQAVIIISPSGDWKLDF